MPAATFATVKTSLGPDKLTLRSMIGREELGRVFVYELELLSDDDKVTLSDLLGQPMTIEVQLGNDAKRYFSGVVCRFAQSGMVGRSTLYRATLRPWLWLLTRSAEPLRMAPTSISQPWRLSRCTHRPMRESRTCSTCWLSFPDETYSLSCL